MNCCESSIKINQGEDVDLVYTPSKGYDFSTFTATMRIWDDAGGPVSPLLTVGMASTVNGSVITVEDRSLRLLLKWADVEALGITELPTLFGYDMRISGPTGVVSTLVGGSLIVTSPSGSSCGDNDGTISVSIESRTVMVIIQGGITFGGGGGGGGGDKLDRNGANAGNEAEQAVLRDNIGAGPIDVITYQEGLTEQTRRVVDKLRDFINAQDAPNFDAARATDAKASLEALFAKSPAGGTIYLPAGDIYVSSLNIPAGIKLIGESSRPGENDANRIQNRYGTTIWLDPAGTIKLQNMAWLEGVQILNPKLRYVTVTGGVPDCTEGQSLGTEIYTTGPFAGQYAGVAQFSGTAITCAGDDTMVRDVLVVGFETAYYSAAYDNPDPILPGPSRQGIDGLWFDTNNGIDITNCWDVAKISNCHGWNFFNGHTGFGWLAALRTGIGYHLHDHVDGAQLIGNFDIGRTIGYRLKDIFGAQLVACTGDGVQALLQGPEHYGFLFEGKIDGTYMNNCQADGKWHGFVFNHNVGAIGAGTLQTGTTGGGAYVFGPGSCGGIANLAIAAAYNDNILVKSGVGEWGIGQITGFYMISNGVGNNLFHFENPADEKKIQRGLAMLDSWAVTNDPMGPSFRTIKAGSHLANHSRMMGADAASSGLPNAGYVASFAAGSDAAVGYDVIAKGNGDASQVRFLRGSPSSREIMGRIAAPTGSVGASFLINLTSSGFVFAPEGSATDLSMVLQSKGSGRVISAPPLTVDANSTNGLSLSGGAAGRISITGSSTNVPIHIVGKGNGGVFLIDDDAGAAKILARVFRSSSNNSNLVVDNGSASVVIAAEDVSVSNATLALAGQGTGGVRIGMGIYADSAAAAAAGVPVNSLFMTPTGDVKVRMP